MQWEYCTVHVQSGKKKAVAIFHTLNGERTREFKGSHDQDAVSIAIATLGLDGWEAYDSGCFKRPIQADSE
jgi:hypothetical protein